LPPKLYHDGAAPAADARVDHGEKNSVGWILGGQSGEQMRRWSDAEGGRIVQRVEER
jgi:hypothetical protein